MLEDQDSFERQLLNALDERTNWYDTNVLLKVQENYRLHHSCVNNIIGVLEKKTLINPDPYKHDKKISDIICPEDTDFADGERAIVLGTRLSDYESMIDFVCNYYKFSVEYITLDKIRKLLELNNTFLWSNLSLNAQKPNTRALATVINAARVGADPLTQSLINDSISKSAKALAEITSDFRALAEFQREVYKGQIRKEILDSAQCNREKASHSAAEMQLEIKRLYPVVMGKRPYYSDLIDEIILEENAPDKQQRRAKLLSTLKVVTATTQKKETVVDTHELLMESVRIIGSLSEQFNVVIDKIKTNHDILEEEHHSLGDKIMKMVRKAFGMAEPPVDYEVIVVDKATETQRRQRIHYNQFLSDLEKRAKYYASFAVRKTPGYMRVSALKDDAIMNFINKQLSDVNDLFALLTALDEFFKEVPSPTNRSRIKGIKMELTTIKNTLVKTNQRRAEYVAFVEEREQMKKLGITE